MSVVVMKHFFRPVTFHVENLKKILPGVVPVKNGHDIMDIHTSRAETSPKNQHQSSQKK